MFYSVMSIFERLKITVYNNRDAGNEILTRNYVFSHDFIHVHFMLSTMSTHWIVVSYGQGMLWNGMEDDFSIFHCAKFLPFHTKIFHSIFDSILKFFPYSIPFFLTNVI